MDESDCSSFSNVAQLTVFFSHQLRGFETQGSRGANVFKSAFVSQTRGTSTSTHFSRRHPHMPSTSLRASLKLPLLYRSLLFVSDPTTSFRDVNLLVAALRLIGGVGASTSIPQNERIVQYLYCAFSPNYHFLISIIQKPLTILRSASL